MKHLISTLLLAALGAVAVPASAEGLDIEVSGIGDAPIAGLKLYSSRFSYPDQPRLTERSGVYDGNAEFHFDDLAPGDYAVVVWADKNENGEFDRSMFGNPKESYVFSNNVHEDEPDWDAVRFTIGGERTQLKLAVAKP